MGLERFIQLSVQVAERVRGCLETHLGQGSTVLRQPECLSSPGPTCEPMQVDYSRLSPTERQRRLNQGLCLYCGQEEHALRSCPTHPPQTLVSVIFSPASPVRPPSTIVQHITGSHCVSENALLDSGSAAN